MTSEVPHRPSSDPSFEHKRHVNPRSGGDRDRGDREEWVWILDYLPYGRENDTRPVYMKKPLVHALGDNKLILMELLPVEGKIPPVHAKTHIGEQGEEFIERVKARITYEELSRGAKMELPIVLEKYIKENESRFIKFFNDATPVSMRQNSLELLPGIGKKLMWDVIEAKKKGPFESFENLKARVPGLHDPEKMLIQRIIDELKTEQKYYLFTARPPQPRQDAPAPRKPGRE
jgi:putative nucleotide binding protein